MILRSPAHSWRSAVVPFAGGPGAGCGVLRHELHDEAARAALRDLPAAVYQVIQRLRPLLALEPAPRSDADVERLRIVDGTLVPVRDRKVGASSRSYRFSANVQVTIDAGTRLVIASARLAAGNKADAHVRRESDLPAMAAGTTVIADGAYLGTGLMHYRRAGRPLLRGQEEDNAGHRRVRARVERTFARTKN